MSQNRKNGKLTVRLQRALGRFKSSSRPAIRLTTVAALSLFIGCLGLVYSSACFAQVPEKTEYYGNWQPPQQTNGNTASQPITRENFRSFFPPNSAPQNSEGQLRPRNKSMATNNVPRTSFQALPPQKHVPTQARPLQPILSSSGAQGMQNGQFVNQVDNQNSGFQPARTARLPDFPNPMTRDRRAAGSQNSIVRQANFEALDNNSIGNSGFSMPPRDANTASMESSQSSTDFSVSPNSTSPGMWAQLKDTTASWFSSSTAETNEGVSSGGESGWQQKVAGIFGGLNAQTKKMVGSLALVLGGYFAFVSVMRKINPQSNQGIPAEVVEVIGNAPFGPRKNLQLVRLGSKLLLLMNGPEGTHPVGEITDANEVEYLISLCTGKRSRASKSVVSAVERLRSAAANNASANSAVNSGASATAIAEVLRVLENRTPSAVFEA